MASTPKSNPPSSQPQDQSSSSRALNRPQRPADLLTGVSEDVHSHTYMPGEASASRQGRGAKGGRKKKKKARRHSFLRSGDDDEDGVGSGGASMRPSEPPLSAASRPPFYQLTQSGHRISSDTSLASEALLDHREQRSMRPRRESRVAQSPFAHRSHHDLPFNNRPSRQISSDGQALRKVGSRTQSSSEDESVSDRAGATDKTPLLPGEARNSSPSRRAGQHHYGSQYKGGRRDSIHRRQSATSSLSSTKRNLGNRLDKSPGLAHDVNNPPSMPNSPKLGPGMGYDDVMVTDSFSGPRSPEEHRNEHIINVDGDADDLNHPASSPPTPRRNVPDQRRHTVAMTAEEDVCFPVEGMSAIGEEDYIPQDRETSNEATPRRRRRVWPDLSVLDEWSREEKESRSEGIRAKTISEPVLVGGRLRPQKHMWHRAEEDAPYRFTYFNEELPSTIHSQTISELLQPGQTFRDLFKPEPPLLSDDESSSEEDDIMSQQAASERPDTSLVASRTATRHPSLIGDTRPLSPARTNGSAFAPSQYQEKPAKPKRFGDRPTFWLDVLTPTDQEMRVISKTFGIHPLTAEDIMMQEAREKVELFPKYYFVNYRTFEQDTNSSDYLEPINMYVIVFPDGVLSFHFSMTPHPANVRRRIRQLKEYLQPSSDWISYALIDDITDVFAPLIQAVEDEVDELDDAILKPLYEKDTEGIDGKAQSKAGEDEKSDAGEGGSSGGHMLRRVGEARKKVMLLYRLLGNKADVIKGFAKRCNERWQIAPKSDIGLYLGDIQDHILTMTSNLSHYETLLSRAHSNFLAQMNIRMNERQEQTADVLGKLTVLGTIVLPMNIITGMWGMNVLVPGQDVDNLWWFWSITAGLLIFGVSCFFIAKRTYGLV